MPPLGSTSKVNTYSFIGLAFTSLVLSRASFLFIDDPEGPNLLIVIVVAAMLLGLAAMTYIYLPTTPLKKLAGALVVQIVMTVVGIMIMM